MTIMVIDFPNYSCQLSWAQFTVTPRVENPKEPIEEAVVKVAMEEMIASGVFTSTNGNFATVKGARVIDRNVTEYEII
jgi:hypothetical protein